MYGGYNMIFLPNSADKYLSALRLYVHLNILKYGIKDKHYKQLKMLSLTEALFAAENTEPADICILSKNLIYAAAAIKLESEIHLKASFSLSGYYKIPRKTYITLLMELLSGGSHCKISLANTDGGILIKLKNAHITRHIPLLIKCLNGFSLRESNSKNMVIYLPFQKCPAAPPEKNGAADYLTDPFSPVTVFLYKHRFDNFI